MSSLTPLITAPTPTTDTPRARRGAAAVFAQYIQDLTHPSPPDPCAAAV
jgi:hypothetical protein